MRSYLKKPTMKLLPIEKDLAQNHRFPATPECQEVLTIFTAHYKKVGFHKPWIAYFMADDHDEIMGGGGYKGKPKDNKVEISYGTFKQHEGKGRGTEICRQLVLLALQTDPFVRITARTLPNNHASMSILKKNGFACLGTVHDEEDGDVLEWEYQKPST
jgi:RimJ/RimL family protein N-acetyltransferase